MKIKILIAFSLALFLFMGCNSKPKNNEVEFGQKEEQVYRNAVKTLASDGFMGRRPFTEGEEKTTRYLEQTFKEIGLQPGNGDSYFQDVPMVEITAHMKDGGSIVKGNGKQFRLNVSEDIVGSTRRVVETQAIKDAPLIFAGFGIDAPEFNWNDYEGLDVKGKVVVVMVNDPGFYTPELFHGKDMTYYGRWTYKFEEAARQGAAGVLVIHDTAPASYGWSVVRSGWSGAQLYLQTENNNMDYTGFEGWISGDAAEKLFKMSGLNESELLEKAKHPGFKAVPLNLTFSVTLENKIVKKQSKNVVGIKPGTSEKDQAVIFSAHWDHFGIGEPVDGDSIYNGAADNASGVAGLIALAKKFHENPPTKRSLLFVALTGEEDGLLGSEYYATHPIFPLKNTVVDINFDVMQPFGLMKDVYLIGKGMSQADGYLEDVARQQGREVRAVEDASNGWYYRSDHFNFAKVGIPTIYIATGTKSADHSEEWGRDQRDEYNDERYHKPQDNYYDTWDVAGTLADLKLIYVTSRNLADTNKFPEWNDGVPFKKAREAQQ